MVRIYPGDLLAIQTEGKYVYVVVLDRILYFGGNWCFALHRVTDSPLKSEEVLGGSTDGFHAFVDFIWAKRENRITRLAKKIDTEPFRGCGLLKGTNGKLSSCPCWWIYDMEGRELRTQQTLTSEEERYPLHETINDILMVERVLAGWRPEFDEDIKVVADYAARIAKVVKKEAIQE